LSWRGHERDQQVKLCRRQAGLLVIDVDSTRAFVNGQPVLSVAEGKLGPDQVDEAWISAHLSTAGLPDADLVIRTGGEQRLSDFLLWESAYAELCFTPVMWPDFAEADLSAAMDDFARRERRFGTVGGAGTEGPAAEVAG
jgi:hypothetical protein